MPKLCELPNNELLIDNSGRIRAVDTVKVIVSLKDPSDAGRTWYTTNGNDFEPDQPVEIGKLEG